MSIFNPANGMDLSRKKGWVVESPRMLIQDIDIIQLKFQASKLPQLQPKQTQTYHPPIAMEMWALCSEMNWQESVDLWPGFD